jgi:4-hydroxybenzoate polyprenyltransferase
MARIAPDRRPRTRTYLLLARVSNLPTVWSNVLAGALGASVALAAPVPSWATAWTALAASLFYTGGMFLNDACDLRFDRTARPERPIPRGEVGHGEAIAIGGVLLFLGEVLLWPNAEALLLGVMLAAAIVLYDVSHKGNRFAPLVMGLCRGLVYLVAAAAAGGISPAVFAGSVLMTLYVASLTVVAKMAGSNARWLVPVLIAGISLVDAAFILIVAPGQTLLALLAAAGFLLTLSLQRWVPGD